MRKYVIKKTTSYYDSFINPGTRREYYTYCVYLKHWYGLEYISCTSKREDAIHLIRVREKLDETEEVFIIRNEKDLEEIS